MNNVLEVKAVVLGSAYGKVVVKYQAIDPLVHAKILAVLNKNTDEDRFKKKYYTQADLNKDFSATPFKAVVREVKLPLSEMPKIGDSFIVGSNSVSLF